MMKQFVTAGLILLSLAGVSSASAAIGPAGTGVRIGPYLNDGASLGLMADIPMAKPVVPLSGKEVFTLGLMAGDKSGAIVSLEHQFGATNATGGYIGLGLGLALGDGSGLGLKATLGMNMDRGSYVQADFIGAGDGGLFIGIGKRF